MVKSVDVSTEFSALPTSGVPRSTVDACADRVEQRVAVARVREHFAHVHFSARRVDVGAIADAVDKCVKRDTLGMPLAEIRK